MRFAPCEKPPEKKTGKKVAIIGSGPAGLTVAGELVCKGHEVHVYDRNPYPGGLLIFGIPEWRMPKEGIKRGIEKLKELGVKFILNTNVDDKKFEEILKEYDAIVIATGAWEDIKLNLPGIESKGIYTALDYLYKRSLWIEGYIPEDQVPKIGKKVIVIGGGNSAMDAARTTRRLGADVTVVYRRTKEYMPASKHEVDAAEKEGVKFIFLASPVKFIPDENGHVKEVEFIRMKLGAPDKSGRPRPEPIPETEFRLEADTVILAVGQRSTPPFSNPEKFGIKVERGRIVTDEYGRTSREGVFACGDVVTGPATIAEAIKTAKKTAMAVHEYLMKKA